MLPRVEYSLYLEFLAIIEAQDNQRIRSNNTMPALPKNIYSPYQKYLHHR